MRRFKQVIAWAICVTMIAGMVGCKQNSPAKTDVQLPDTFMPSDISISDEDIAYEDNTLYADSQILLTVRNGTTYETVEKLVQKEEGIIIGFINFSGTYHVDFPRGKTYKELSSIISQWERKAYIEMASLNHVFSLSGDSINYTEEKWLNTTNKVENGSTDWDESNPAGNNWWAEAIRMPSVWEMDIWESNNYSPINIGIIDSVFDEKHEDLDEVFEKIWYNQEGWKLLNSIQPEDEELISKKEHGTHVAGLIAAEMGNGCGIAGVASCAEPKLLGFSVHGASAQNVYVGVAHWLYAMALMFEENVKIINISRGLDDTLVYAAQKGNEAAKERISQYDEMLESFLSSAINAGYDFLIVKSSGNTSNNKFVSCDPTIETPYGYREVKDGEKGESTDCSAKYSLLTGISDSEVSARIITVGAAERSEIRSYTGYNRAGFSNLDCDVYAPGVNILSTIPIGTNTKALQGTSMATPIVSGIAALAWSVNPDLTGPQVKKLIVESYEEKLKAAITSNLIFTNPLDSLGSGINTLAGLDLVMVVDAACVVNKALQLREPTEVPIKDDSDECAIIGAVCYEIIDENGDKQIHGIPEALVSLKPKIDESITFYELLDDLGGFSNYYPEGEYTLRATADGYEPFEQNIRLVKGKVLYLPISLIPLVVTPKVEEEKTQSTQKQLIKIKRDNDHNVDQERIFSYNANGQLTQITTMWMYDDGDVKEVVDMRYEYDSEDRLVRIFEGKNDVPMVEYIYDENGRLTTKVSEYESISTYEYDASGKIIRCVSEDPYSKSVIEYTYNDHGLLIETLRNAELTFMDSNDTSKQTYYYDTQHRLITEVYESVGLEDPYTSTTTYCYDYQPFVLITNDADLYNPVLALYDEMGKRLWSESFQTLELITDESGYLTCATTSGVVASNPYSATLEFIYADSDANYDVRAYIPVVEQAILEEMFRPQSKGMLYDMDSDGIQELIMIHEKAEMEGDVCIGEYHVCSVFDIENGIVTVKMDEKYLNSMAGAPESYVGIVEYKGKTLFLVHTTNAGDASAGTTNILYDPLTFREVLNQQTDKYASVIDGIRYIDMIDDGYGSMDEFMISGMLLDDLLAYLKNDQ